MFSFIKTGKTPQVGELVRNLGDGSRLSEVVKVAGNQVHLQGYYDTSKGPIKNPRIVVHEWKFHEEFTAHRWTHADNQRYKSIMDKWYEDMSHPIPVTKSTGSEYLGGGYWSTDWHRPVKENSR
jgi:hypothetical protein